MPYLTRLLELKQEKKMTNADIARLADLPLATVTRVFNGTTPNPTFETFAHIAIALGVSLDEIVGLKQNESNPVDAPIETTLSTYAEILKEKDERIKELKAERDKERIEKHRIIFALTCIVIVISIVLGIDILHGHLRYFRY